MKSYHPEIEKLETTEIDDTFSKDENTKVVGRASKFYVVPTDMVINGDRELWKGCPSLVNWDLLKCIEEIVERGDYPYNSTVGELFCKKFNLPQYEEHTFLSAMVYCTQSYKSSVNDEKIAKEFHEQMTAKGYVKATDDILNRAADTTRKFYVVRNGTNFLGGDCKVLKEEKLLLKDWGERSGGYHWKSPRAKKSGYRAKIGQYIKEVI